MWQNSLRMHLSCRRLFLHHSCTEMGTIYKPCLKMSPTIFPLIILCVFRQLETAGNPKISPPGSRKSALWHFSLCSRAFHRAPDQNFICSVTRIQQMFNIYIHIRGKANPTHHWLTCAYTFSCEQLQPGIFKTAVRRVFGVIVSQRASPLNVARCSQHNIYTYRQHMYDKDIIIKAKGKT